ncbi:unnamed protein product, partial [Coregonus sp. 'balchen']
AVNTEVLSFLLSPDVNECLTANGGCEGHCCNTIGSFYCKCPEGSRLGPDGKACQGEKEGKLGLLGVCGVESGIAVNSCSVKNGGCEHKCVDMGNDHYKCECRRNYQLKMDGKHCELRDPCVDRNEGCAQLCRSVDGQAECSCRTGYTLARDHQGCDDIDECSSGQAMCAHRCVNTLGSFSCVCNLGFELGADGKQCYRIEMEIVNSCEKNNGGCSHHCEHTTNGPLCSCNQGYQLTEDRKTCVDSDECESGEACCSQFCKNYPGGYECSCKAGYRLHADGCDCNDIDECLAESSVCEQYCVNTLGTYECFCRLGFRLDHDQRACIPLYDSDLDDDEEEDDAEEDLEVHRLPDLLFRRPPQLLQYTAALHSPYGDDEEEEAQRGELTLVSHIVCLDDSFGDDCSVSCADCENGALCGVDRDFCECTPGWTGVICNETCPVGTYGQSCNTLCRCQNGGSCEPVTGRCVCPPGVQGQLCEDGCPQGYFGKHCRRKCNCPNNGRCHRLYGACLCAPGLYGRFCHLPCPRWTHGVSCSEECDCVLEHSLICHPKNGTCLCKSGYHGSQCHQGKLFWLRQYSTRILRLLKKKNDMVCLDDSEAPLLCVCTVPVKGLDTPTHSRVFLYFYCFLHCGIIVKT